MNATSMALGAKLNPARFLLWYGRRPLAGVRSRLEVRGFKIEELNGDETPVPSGKLALATAVVFHHTVDGVGKEFSGYKNIKDFIDHGLPIFIVCNPDDEEGIIQQYLIPHGAGYPWRETVTFIPDFKDVNFDHFVLLPPRPISRSGYDLQGPHEKLTAEEKTLLQRAFPKAAALRLTLITPGYKGRVFMVYEKRQQSSLSHWMQPRLVKIGAKDDVLREVEAMKQVSSYIPFELRPNYEAHAAGFTRALYVADFIDKSESLLDAAHDGRAEAALSALFFRTLGVWRDCASQRRLSGESLADAAERLKMFSVDKIRPEYLQSPEFADSGIDPSALWAKAKKIQFGHRVATIHGDLHGRNVRVRGEDAIVIDLAEIKGTDDEGEGAPLCFDVAMLDVALGFQCLDKPAKAGNIDCFQQPEWTEEIESYYNFESLLNGPPTNEKRLGRWLHGCLQRIRAFANYDQSNQLEYPIAVAIAMWRWCKFRYEGENDKGRRVKALLLGAAILQKAIKRHEESQRGKE